MSNLVDLLGAEALWALVEQYRGVAEPLPFHSMFMKGQQGVIEANTARFERVTNRRALAPVRSRESAPHIVAKPNRKYIRYGCLTISLGEELQPHELFEEAAYGKLLPDAEDYIQRSAVRVMSDLFRGVEYICAKLLESSSGATVSPATMPGTNQAFTYAADSFVDITASAKWDVAATPIFSGVNQLYDAVRKLEENGYAAGRFITNGAPIKALIGNTEAQGWFQRNGTVTIEKIQEYARGIGNGSILKSADPFRPNTFDGVAGIEHWHTWDHGYQNVGASFTRFLADTVGIVAPEDFEHLGFAEGYGYVPQGPVAGNVIGLSEATAKLLKQSKGMTVYATMSPDHPHAIKIIGTYTFLPALLDPLGQVVLKTIL